MTAAPVYAIEEIHLGTSVNQVARFELLTETRLLRVPRQCQDCNGTPEVIPPLTGFQAALLLIHDPSCPLLNTIVSSKGNTL